MTNISFPPSILLRQKHLENHDIFSFKTVQISDIEKEINNTNPKKRTTTAFLLKFKKSSKVSASVLHKLFYDSIKEWISSKYEELADITPAYKKNDPLDKANYRSVSVLPVVSKSLERIV